MPTEEAEEGFFLDLPSGVGSYLLLQLGSWLVYVHLWVSFNTPLIHTFKHFRASTLFRKKKGKKEWCWWVNVSRAYCLVHHSGTILHWQVLFLAGDGRAKGLGTKHSRGNRSQTENCRDYLGVKVHAFTPKYLILGFINGSSQRVDGLPGINPSPQENKIGLSRRCVSQHHVGSPVGKLQNVQKTIWDFIYSSLKSQSDNQGEISSGDLQWFRARMDEPQCSRTSPLHHPRVISTIQQHCLHVPLKLSTSTVDGWFHINASTRTSTWRSVRNKDGGCAKEP